MTPQANPPRRRPRASSVCLFLALAAVMIAAHQAAHGFFPGSRAVAQAGRLLCMVAGLVVLVVGSRWLLGRDGIDRNRLGLGTDSSSLRAFSIGVALACAHMLALMVALYCVVPFELSGGPLPVEAVALAALGYLTGNFGEELVFRGYLFVALAHWLGTTRAIWSLALPFGLFHFPGLDPMALAKMIATTGAMHFVYAYAFLATRSLWAAVSMHALGNTLLHQVFGTGGPALLSIHYSRPFPNAVDAPFLVFFGITIGFAVFLSRLEATRSGAAWLISDSSPTDSDRARAP
jgi:membrane protease YdiL (CAAX protease family)